MLRKLWHLLDQKGRNETSPQRLGTKPGCGQYNGLVHASLLYTVFLVPHHAIWSAHVTCKKHRHNRKYFQTDGSRQAHSYFGRALSIDAPPSPPFSRHVPERRRCGKHNCNNHHYPAYPYAHGQLPTYCVEVGPEGPYQPITCTSGTASVAVDPKTS